MVKVVGIRFRNAGKIYYFGPGKIKLDDDITLKSRINCKKNTVIELDLNGHTITGQIMNNGADCTIKNGTLNDNGAGRHNKSYRL